MEDNISQDELSSTVSAEGGMETSPADTDSTIQKVDNESEKSMIRIGSDADETIYELNSYQTNTPRLSNSDFVITVDNDGDEDDGIILSAPAEVAQDDSFDPIKFQDSLIEIVNKALEPIINETDADVNATLDNIDDTANIPSGNDDTAIDISNTNLSTESQNSNLKESGKIKIKLPERDLDTIMDHITGTDVDYTHSPGGDSILVDPKNANKVKQFIKKMELKNEITESNESTFAAYDKEKDELHADLNKDEAKDYADKGMNVKPQFESQSLEDLIESFLKEDSMEGDEGINFDGEDFQDTSDTDSVESDNLDTETDEDVPEEDKVGDSEVVVTKNSDGSVHIKGDVFGLLVAFTNEETAKEIITDVKTSKLENPEDPALKIESLIKKAWKFIKESVEGGKVEQGVDLISKDFEKDPDNSGEAYGNKTPEEFTFFQKEGVVAESNEGGDISPDVNMISPDFSNLPDISGEAYGDKTPETYQFFQDDVGSTTSKKEVEKKTEPTEKEKDTKEE